ncbi:MAG: tetratricopeptide repeat protein [Symploca sp. SIO1B1]|nr:tetratricopeptide repeat protein [Symploca sp. SIO1B1]
MLKKALHIVLIVLPVAFAELWLLDFGVRLLTVEVVAQTVDERKLEADRLFDKGIEQYDISQFGEALQLWQAQTVDEPKVEADRLLQEGEKQYRISQFREALQLWQQALVIYREIGARQGEANSLNNLGNVYSSLAEYEQAIDFYEQSLELFREIRDRQGEANSLGNLGNVYSSLAEYEQAKDFYEQSLAIAREIGDRQGEANSLNNLAIAYRQEKANSLNNLGIVYYSFAEYERAKNFHEKSLAIKRQIGYRHEEAYSSDGSQVLSYPIFIEYKQAIDFYEQALELFREIGDRQEEANSLNGLGLVYASLEEYEQAIDSYEKSLAIKRQIGDPKGEAYSLNNLGNIYYGLEKYKRAIDFHKQSLAISQKIGYRQGEAYSLHNLSKAYHRLGEYKRGIDFHKQSLDILREIGDRQVKANSLKNLGNSYKSLAEYKQAIDFHEQSLAISREIGARLAETNSLNNLGNIYYSLGEYEGAIDFYKQSLAIKIQIGYRQGEAASLGNLGVVYASLAEYEQAIDFHEQSLDIFREIGYSQGEALALGNLGATFKNSGNFTEAEPYLYDSINIYEEIRTQLSSNNDAWKVSIFEKQTNPYISLQQVLIAQNKPQQALLISERGRARALVDLSWSKQSLTPQPPNLQKIQNIAQEQNATLVEYSVINNSELYIWVIPPDGEIQFRSVNLPQDISLQQLVKVSREQIGIRGRGSNNATPQTNDNTNHLQQLHQLLIAPIADLLPTEAQERIIFIPHQELFLVPFAALPDKNGTYLIEKHTILTAPSIQSLSLTRQHRERVKNLPGETLIVGNPIMPQFKNLSPLPGAETEAKKIAQILDTEPLIGAEATETTIVQKMPNAKIIHLATHGLLDDISGVGSPGAIALAPTDSDDGFLTSREIMEQYGLTNTTPLQAELVVLSACDTGRGDIKGEGVVGLSRSLIAAGVPSLVVSLWKVPDDATQELMVEFYTNLYEKKLDKAQALRQAMLTMLKDDAGNPDPLDWAAFTIIGEAE